MSTYLKLSIISIFSAIIMTSCGSNSTTLLTATPKLKVINIENTPKNTLFVKANDWMVENFTDAKSVVQFSDKGEGVVTGKYLLHSKLLSYVNGIPGYDYIYAIIKVKVKDNAAKITIKPEPYTNQYNSFCGGKSYPLERAYNDMDNLINSFEVFMNSEQDSF